MIGLPRFFFFLQVRPSTAAADVDMDLCDLLRQQVASVILSNPDDYSEAILGKEPMAYVDWLSKRESWGGKLIFGRPLKS